MIFGSNKDSYTTMKVLQVIHGLILFSILPLFASTQTTEGKYVIYAPLQMAAEALQDFKYLLEKSTGKNNQLKNKEQKPLQSNLNKLIK
jgi:hypothetical protein